MYYILAALFFVIAYFSLVKLLSSVVKGCLVTLGLAIILGGGYVMIISTKSPVNLFDYVVVDNFEVTFINP